MCNISNKSIFFIQIIYSKVYFLFYISTFWNKNFSDGTNFPDQRSTKSYIRTINLSKQDSPSMPASLIYQRKLIVPKICVVVSFNLCSHLDYASTGNRRVPRILPRRERIFSILCLIFFRPVTYHIPNVNARGTI